MIKIFNKELKVFIIRHYKLSLTLNYIMKYITRSIYKLLVTHEMRNVRFKFTKAAVLKTVKEPLVLEDFKITDKLKEGQVNIII